MGLLSELYLGSDSWQVFLGLEQQQMGWLLLLTLTLMYILPKSVCLLATILKALAAELKHLTPLFNLNLLRFREEWMIRQLLHKFVKVVAPIPQWHERQQKKGKP